MTIHVAKGLEFDHVFVPGLAKGLLPNTTIQHNPAERGKSMDFELRGDASYLPRYDGNLSAFKKDLKQQEEYEERRTAYVAMTRARRSLHVTGAHWYAENMRAKEAGPFLRELKDWIMETKHATWDPGADIDEEHNPILGYRERFVRDWPGPALPAERDPVFPEGWRHAAVAVAESAGVIQDSLLEPLDPDGRAALQRLGADRRGLALHLREREEVEGRGGEMTPPRNVSVGGVIDYARCPKRFYWTSVRPLPRFSGPAARIGTEVHRWIERRSSGQGQLLELDDAPDLTAEELATEPGKVDRLRQAFLASRFAGVVPLFAERAFLLRLDGFAVSGRIDAVFGAVEGPWEVVDWKTGRRPPADDPLAGLQLDLYGLACVEVWGKRPDDLTLTYLYLAGGEEVSHPMGDPDEVRARVGDALRAIGEGAFDPTPGPWCHHCDFLSFCDAGRGWVAADT
jgi:DNA helicase-2/ATP-dependent DNA helicase PcrA